MDMLDFILKMKKTYIVESFDIFFENVGGKIMNVLEYFRFKFLNRLQNLLILLGNIGFKEKAHN